MVGYDAPRRGCRRPSPRVARRWPATSRRTCTRRTWPPGCALPDRPLVPLPHTLTEVTGPLLGDGRVAELDHDLTRQHAGEPLGERIVVTGRLLDGDGCPVPGTLVEVWQANAAGRYRHEVDQHPAPSTPTSAGPAAV